MCELYRRRWRIEEAFALTKRVLDLAYLWTGSTNAVQLQIYATLIFYAVLLTICQQVAQVLGEPLERISVEMVFRAFYHYSRAVERGETDDLVQFLAEHTKLLGIVKRRRKHHRECQQLDRWPWGSRWLPRRALRPTRWSRPMPGRGSYAPRSGRPLSSFPRSGGYVGSIITAENCGRRGTWVNSSGGGHSAPPCPPTSWRPIAPSDLPCGGWGTLVPP